MKIVHFITSLKIGGAEVALFNRLKNSNREDDEHIVVYLYDGPIASKIKSLGIKTYQVKGLLSIYDPLSLFRIYKLIKNISPDVLHTALWSANIIGRVVARRLKISIICDMHGDVVFQGKFRNFFEKLTIGMPNYIVAVSKSVKKALEENFVYRIKNKKKRESLQLRIILIQNGIDVEEMRSVKSDIKKEDIGLGKDDFVVGSVGRLEPIKSYDVLLQSLAFLLNKENEKYKNLKLCLIGDGSQKETLEELSSRLGITSNVKFIGWKDNPLKFYPIFDCFALSSQSEGLSIALLEALAFGLPLVSTHILGQPHDVINDGESGFLVTSGDFKALAGALSVLYLDSVLLEAMRKNNKKLAECNFNIKNVVEGYDCLYRRYDSSSNKFIKK